jgi:hypothetical protein
MLLPMPPNPRCGAPGSPMPHQPLSEREARRVTRYLLDLESQREDPAPMSLADPDHPAWIEPPAGERGSAAGLNARHRASRHSDAVLLRGSPLVAGQGPLARVNAVWSASTRPCPTREARQGSFRITLPPARCSRTPPRPSEDEGTGP